MVCDWRVGWLVWLVDELVDFKVLWIHVVVVFGVTLFTTSDLGSAQVGKKRDRTEFFCERKKRGEIGSVKQTSVVFSCCWLFVCVCGV